MSDPGPPTPARARKSAAAFRTIGEVAGELDLPAHVLRFWETKFPRLKPVKRSGGRRYYRPEDIELLRRIRQWLYQEGYTIRGVQQLLEHPHPDIAGELDGPDITGPVMAGAPDPNAAAGLGVDLPSGQDVEAMDPSHATAPPGPDRKPESLDPETRAELEEIRRELLEARALLDELLRQSKER